ncbi:MAG: ABC transporter transmembrane domain-containing protein, partial [Candidatus Thermoplasmatota archaeon]|nr:ABC transporter transmembrane domain-containing protein [Candidatus Thermoplasmatota archaeon]
MTPVNDSRALYGRLLGYVKPYWRMFALSIVALILTAATEPLLPALFKPLLDEGFVAKDADFIRWVPVLLLALFLVRGVTGFISTYCMAWVGSRLVMDLRAAMFDKLMTLPTRYFDQNPSGLVWGSAVGVFAWLLYDNPALGGVMALAMLLNLLVAALAGIF